MSKVEIKITEKGGVKGSESGLELNQYDEGKTYSVTEDFADNLVRGGLAEYANGKTAEKNTEAKPKAEKPAKGKGKKAESKAVDKSPENKALKGADENK